MILRDTIEAPARFWDFLVDGDASALLDADDLAQARTLYNRLACDGWYVVNIDDDPYRGAWDAYGLGSPESRARYHDCSMLTYVIERLYGT